MTVFYGDLSKMDSLEEGAVRAVDLFAKEDNKLDIIGYFQTQDQVQAVVLIAILNWEQVRKSPEVSIQLNTYQDRQPLELALSKLSHISLSDIASSIRFHGPLIKKFFGMFSIQQLNDILDQSKLIYVKMGVYKQLSDQTGDIKKSKTLGNKQAPVSIAIVKSTSQQQTFVLLTYSSDSSDHQTKFTSGLSNLTVSNVTSNRVSESLQDQRRSVPSPNSQIKQTSSDIRNSGGVPMEPEDNTLEIHPNQIKTQGKSKPGHCSECETYSVLGSENRLCWRCFQRSIKKDPMDIICWSGFIILVVVLVLLNYHHARESRTVTQFREYPKVNNAAQGIYESMFSFARQVKNTYS